MRVRSAVLLLSFVAAAGAQTAAHRVVLLDAYHNQEPAQPLHYRWEGTDNGGFSELGAMLRRMGAELRTTTTEITAKALQGVDCLIIVDPDTPAESPHPHYIAPQETAAIASWVKAGGRLVLLGNNEGNAEFEHFNQLASRFGFSFVNSTIDKSGKKGILTLSGTGPLFDGAPNFYAVDVAPVRIEGRRVEPLLSTHGTPVMVLAKYGSGVVFGLGDPWIYNEYIHRSDNAAIAEKLFRTLLQ